MLVQLQFQTERQIMDTVVFIIIGEKQSPSYSCQFINGIRSSSHSVCLLSSNPSFSSDILSYGVSL